MVLPDHFLSQLAAHETAARRGVARRRSRRSLRHRPTVRQLQRSSARRANAPCCA